MKNPAKEKALPENTGKAFDLCIFFYCGAKFQHFEPFDDTLSGQKIVHSKRNDNAESGIEYTVEGICNVYIDGSVEKNDA